MCIEQVLEALKKLPHLESLFLTGSEIYDREVEYIAKELPLLVALKELGLTMFYVTDKGKEALLRAAAGKGPKFELYL